MEIEQIISFITIIAGALAWLGAKYGNFFLKVRKAILLVGDCAETKADPDFKIWLDEGRRLAKKHFGEEGDVLADYFHKKIEVKK